MGLSILDIGRDNAEHQRMAPCSLGTGQYYPFDASVLLHRHFDVSTKATDQRADINTYTNYSPDRAALGHAYPGTRRPNGDAAPNPNAVVSTYTHAYIHPTIHAYTCSDIYGHATSDSHVNHRTDSDIHLHADAYKHA
jgi:hypothetical protein